ncbi:hypothetical protein BD410DRAFT_877772 [Rickenella mellea]|uniref:Protein kinase domain-containing protein n=1 Tax=Rickenella mellea TaxID=50990 RepID=A0A4Y7PV40_9AGAM|nr:hypothetical protein BD410DRAFT_877772 [Rickenella mellea]
MRKDCALCIPPLVSFNSERNWASLRALQGDFLHAILKHIYTASILPRLEEHWCSMLTPCIKARPLLADFMSLRLVSHTWSNNWKSLFSTNVYFRDRRPSKGNKLPLPGGISFKVGYYYPSLKGQWFQSIAGRYRLQSVAQCQSSVSVYLARDHGGPLGCENCPEVAIKLYSRGCSNDCKREKLVYEKLTNAPMKGVPEISWRGECTEGYLFAMTNLGPTLQDFRDHAPNKKLNDRLLLHTAIQLVQHLLPFPPPNVKMDRYKDLHNRQIIHNGVKPGNIAVCPSGGILGSPDRAIIYIIDFGFSQYLRDEPKEESISANTWYASVMTHWECRQSQRDDLESLCYLFCYLFHGTLPWIEGRYSRAVVRYKKMKTKKSELFAGMDPAFGDFWDAVKLLAWGEVPDYDTMKQRFCRSWKEKGYDGEPGTVDWLVMWNEMTEAYKARKAEEGAKRLSEEAAKVVAEMKTDDNAMEKPVTANVDDAMKATPQNDGKEVDSVMVSGGDAHIEDQRGELNSTQFDVNHLEKVAQEGKALTVDTADVQATDHTMTVDTGFASSRAVADSDEDATQNTSSNPKIGIEIAEGAVDGAMRNGAPTADNMVVDVAPSILADQETDVDSGSVKSPSSDLVEASSASYASMQVTKPENTGAITGEPGSTALAADIEDTKEASTLVKNDLGGEDGKSGDVVVLVVDAMVVDGDIPKALHAKVDTKDNSFSNDTLGCDRERQPAMQRATGTDSVKATESMEVVVCG